MGAMEYRQVVVHMDNVDFRMWTTSDGMVSAGPPWAAQLNEMGADGWELRSLMPLPALEPSSPRVSQQFLAVFSRQAADA